MLSGGFLYQSTADGSVSAIRASDGATAWRVVTTGATPWTTLIYNGVLYVNAAGVCALRAADGAEVWRSAPGYSLPVRASASMLSAGATTGSVILEDNLEVVHVRASDGASSWRFAVTPRSQEGDDAASCWAVDHGHAYVLNMSDYEDIACYALNLADGSVAWRYPSLDLELTQQWAVQPVAVDQDGVYLLSNGGTGYDLTHLYALDPADGSVRWRVGLAGAAFKYGRMFHGVLYLTVANTAELVAFEPGDGRLRWRRELGPYDNAISLLHGDHLFVDSLHAGLFVLDVHSGITLWQYPATQSVRALAASTELVYLAVTFNALNMPPGSHFLCALRTSDQVLIWRYDVPSFFHGATAGP